MYQRNLTLLTDLYELTMMQGYFKEKDANETVIFDAFYRKQPVMAMAFAICAGLEQVIEYVKNLHFSQEDIDLSEQAVGLFDEDFLDYLRNFQFSGRYLCNSGRHPWCFRAEPLHQSDCADHAKHSWLRLPS